MSCVSRRSLNVHRPTSGSVYIAARHPSPLWPHIPALRFSSSIHHSMKTLLYWSLIYFVLFWQLCGYFGNQLWHGEGLRTLTGHQSLTGANLLVQKLITQTTLSAQTQSPKVYFRVSNFTTHGEIEFYCLEHQPAGTSSASSFWESASNVSSVLGTFSPDTFNRLLEVQQNYATIQAETAKASVEVQTDTRNLPADSQRLSYSAHTQTHLQAGLGPHRRRHLRRSELSRSAIKWT